MKCFGMCFCWSTHSLAYKSIIKINIEFERCIDFLVWMIDKYGEEVLQELEEEKKLVEEKDEIRLWI
ncbi:his Kinase A domain protein [Ligilactobacillus ruminis]|nr:his Kinase A domain protein [Ligilactobacillus ruminis]